ncbi:hypothetical protein ACFQ4C_23650 [Larkinella insperata]|uniref:Lipocalin-like domain-containing protein n=1 Tax=Larkinella insperata TaxID=332158 RepID=A0ABW3QNQ9_9BACT|nr:hypothetical protein [Larkinella insperata]
MKPFQTSLLLFALIFAALACEPSCGCSPAPEKYSPLVGRWELSQIKYGMTGTVATPQQAGYTETLDYYADGTFRRLKNDREEENGSFRITQIENIAGFTEALYYQNKTYQPYRLQENTLLLYERAPNDGVIADGATYTYRKL